MRKKRLIIKGVIGVTMLVIVIWMSIAFSGVRVTEDDFSLDVTMSSTDLIHGDMSDITVVLRNNSVNNVRISHVHLFSIAGSGVAAGASVRPRTVETFEASGIRSRTWLGEINSAQLEPGTHEVTATATFYVNWQRTRQQHIVLTATLEFTVLSGGAE